jgi:nucleotide-binding universal stress UspA family protein
MEARMKIAHILIPTDLSGEALRPCLPIAELARTLKARITLLHVIVEFPIAGFAAPGESLTIPSDLDERLAAARALLEKQRPLFEGLDLAIEVVPGLDPAHQVVEFAENNQVDLIAMSTHGRTGFRHLVLGSVAEAVLRRSTVPVVVFPRPAAEAQRAHQKTA